MTDKQLDALEEAAKAATPGPWEHRERAHVVQLDETPVANCVSYEFAQAPKNAAFIAAANPAVVLDLITELRRMKEEWRYYKDYIVECNRRLEDILELLNIEPDDSGYAKLSYIYHSVKRLQEELRQVQEELRQARAERDWLARDIACSACQSEWAKLTWKPEYWLGRAAKEATK